EMNLQFRIKQYDFSQKVENSLLDFYYQSEEKIKVEFWNSITLSQLKSLIEFSEDFFWSELNNGTGAIVGTIISRFDEEIFNQYRIKANSTFLNLVNVNLHNPDFVEALIIIKEKAKNVSEELAEIIEELFSYSELYSIKSRVNKSGSMKADNYFSVLYNNAFKYKIAKIITSKGEVAIRFLPHIAPISVGNFVYLVNLSFFNNVNFHRVVPGFVIQAGDKSGTGWYGAGYEINSELSYLNYSEGMVGMASAGKDTEGSQWFIMQGEHSHLNGNYTVWAEIISGLSVVQSIEQEDRIFKIILE
ncbi:MAG TPA: peptidylprolyl isomerase, partial [Ignavibacteriaceae bacterium]|nr:peptidylprolyl isomerase [Ignavibacteriaceae bacterium]